MCQTTSEKHYLHKSRYMNPFMFHSSIKNNINYNNMIRNILTIGDPFKVRITITRYYVSSCYPCKKNPTATSQSPLISLFVLGLPHVLLYTLLLTSIYHQLQTTTRNATRCNNRNVLLHLSFALKISIFSETDI